MKNKIPPHCTEIIVRAKKDSPHFNAGDIIQFVKLKNGGFTGKTIRTGKKYIYFRETIQNGEVYEFLDCKVKKLS